MMGVRKCLSKGRNISCILRISLTRNTRTFLCVSLFLITSFSVFITRGNGGDWNKKRKNKEYRTYFFSAKSLYKLFGRTGRGRLSVSFPREVEPSSWNEESECFIHSSSVSVLKMFSQVQRNAKFDQRTTNPIIWIYWPISMYFEYIMVSVNYSLKGTEMWGI